MVFQRAENFIVGATCAEELAVGPRLQGWSKSATQEFVTESLLRIGLEGSRRTLDLHPTTAKQLACLAATAGSDVIIFDEPTAGVDDAGVVWFAQLCCDLTATMVGLIVITHDYRLMNIGASVAAFENGCVSMPAPAEAVSALLRP